MNAFLPSAAAHLTASVLAFALLAVLALFALEMALRCFLALVGLVEAGAGWLVSLAIRGRKPAPWAQELTLPRAAGSDQ